MDLASSVAHASCLQRLKCNPVAEAADEWRSPTWGVFRAHQETRSVDPTFWACPWSAWRPISSAHSADLRIHRL